MTAWQQIRPKLAKNPTHKERGQLIVLGLASIYEGLLAVLSLGYLDTSIRGYLLFEYFDPED